MSILIKNGRVIDPSSGFDGVADCLVQEGLIRQIKPHSGAGAKTVFDASGKVVLPGLVDLHVHLREPGREDKETIASGTQAAARGGVTTCLAMPNTLPATDSAEAVVALKEGIRRSAAVNVLVCAAITRGRLGRELTDFKALRLLDVPAVSDDGSSVDDEELLMRALQEARPLGLLVIEHCEDRHLSGHGVVNRGIVATRLGLRGISNESEYARVSRNIELSRATGARLHLAHISAAESVALIAQAKKEGVPVTAEVTPHHLALTQEAVLSYDTNMKMNPPLRSRADRGAVSAGLCAGTIDAVASDHAPHTINEKDIEFDRAEFGVIGLQTMLSVCFEEFILSGALAWIELARRLSLSPAQILGIERGALREGAVADLCVFDPQRSWTVNKDSIVSKSKNSPFLGRTLRGAVDLCLCGGRVAFRHDSIL